MSPKRLSRSKAWTLAALNQLAFPGAGTVMAGRKIGYAQATIMVVGFVLVMLYLFVIIGSLMSLLTGENTSEAAIEADRHRYAWAGILGLVLSVLAWFWALASSISMVRNAQKDPPVLRP